MPPVGCGREGSNRKVTFVSSLIPNRQESRKLHSRGATARKTIREEEEGAILNVTSALRTERSKRQKKSPERHRQQSPLRKEKGGADPAACRTTGITGSSPN